MLRPLSKDWRYLARASVAAEEVFERLLELEKAKRPAGGKSNILSRPGFESNVRRMVGKLSTATGSADADAIRRAAKILDAKWDKLSAAQRTKVIAAAAEGLAEVPKIVVPKVVGVLQGELPAIVDAAKKATGTKHGFAVAASLSEQDERIVDFAAKSQGSYITDQYGVRATQFEQRARDIVADGLEEGLGREEISERLSTDVIGSMLGRAESYWDQVASIHVSRARSYGQMSSYADAGIDEYVISAARDEVTCVVCYLMNGKTFSVGSAMQSYVDVEESDDPYAVEREQPFISVGRTDEGDRFLFARVGDTIHHLATVLRDPTGERDSSGSYGSVASRSKFEDVGCQQPPFHGSCRCLTVPA